MSYSEDTASLLFFSSDRETLLELTSSLADRLDKKGGKFRGPIPLPTVDNEHLRHFLSHLQDPDQTHTLGRGDLKQWLFEIATDETNMNALLRAAEQGSAVFGRRLEVEGDMSISSIFDFEMPGPVYAVAMVDKREYNKGLGFDPYTWDPNNDHIPSHPDGW